MEAIAVLMRDGTDTRMEGEEEEEEEGGGLTSFVQFHDFGI